jgi:hypothetical protein
MDSIAAKTSFLTKDHAGNFSLNATLKEQIEDILEQPWLGHPFYAWAGYVLLAFLALGIGYGVRRVVSVGGAGSPVATSQPSNPALSQPAPSQPVKTDAKSERKPGAKPHKPANGSPSVSSRDHGTSVGTIEQSGNCNPTIIGGSNNRATANCGTQDRTLTAEQQKQFATHLKEVPGDLVIRVHAINDVGATRYAQSMYDVVMKNRQRYGWEQSPNRTQYQGITLISHTGEGLKVKGLCDWMKFSLGVSVQCSEDQKMPSDVAYIYVDLLPQ